MSLENLMSNLPPFVWVEIGRRPGKYALNAISINKELFPEQERFLIVSKQYKNKLPKDLCTVISEEELKESSNYTDFNALEKQWSYSHKSYWQNTTKRFFVISILVVNKVQALQEFNSYVLKNWHKQDTTDMTLLGNYALDKKDANYLPSGDEVNSKIVFDAGTIGRYFLGGEARNNRIPVSSRGSITSEKGAFLPNKFKVGKIKDGLFLIDAKDEDNNLKLGCIHVHSKRIPKRYQKLINRLIRESNSNRGWFWRLGRLDFTVVSERILSKLSKVMPRTSNSDVRLR